MRRSSRAKNGSGSVDPTVKRDGTCKCRAVCLGNLYKRGGHLGVYASVISQSAARYMLASGAADQDYVSLFDIDNAFVQALIDSEVFIRLPPSWRTDPNDSGIRKLVRALYGLPQAPRLWAKHYERGLAKLGWIQSGSRGLWRKESKVFPGKLRKLGVYVDDNIATGPRKSELDEEVKAILEVFLEGHFLTQCQMVGRGATFWVPTFGTAVLHANSASLWSGILRKLPTNSA